MNTHGWPPQVWNGKKWVYVKNPNASQCMPGDIGPMMDFEKSWVEKLYPEQRPSFDFVISRPGTLLISETSAGKTFISMAAIEHLRPQLLLVVAPLTSLDITWAPKLAMVGTVCRNLKELKQVQGCIKSILASKSKSVSKQVLGLSQQVAAGARLILLIHFQLFAKLATKLERVPWNLVIIDESQGIKDRSSAQSRAARRMRNVKRRLALSATPLDKSPIDIWAQMRFVNHKVFGEDFGAFKNEYCYLGGYKNHEVRFKKEKMPKFLKKLEPYIFRLDKKFLNIPPMHVHLVPVQLLGSQRKLYQEMEEHGIINIGKTAIPAPLAVTRQVKLEQITGGTILDQDGRPFEVGEAKLRKLHSLLTRLEPPVVVFCKYLSENSANQGSYSGQWGY